MAKVSWHRGPAPTPEPPKSEQPQAAGGMVWSPQQQAAFEWVRSGKGHAVLEAVAGSGKTTTLVEICRIAKGKVVFTAYNKKIADEIGLKLQRSGAGPNVTSATFHSLGFKAYRQLEPKVKVEAKKLDQLMEEMKVPRYALAFVSQLVSLAKQRGIGLPHLSIDSDSPWIDLVEHFDLEEKLISQDYTIDIQQRVADSIQMAKQVLRRSNEQRDIIDFDDMIYLPLLLGAKVEKYDWVLVDEAQDTNPTRRELAKLMISPLGGRLIAVGDRHQAIYGFTGADSDALDLIVEELHATRLPLTVTYRCPKSVVRLAQQFVHHIEAHASAPDGVVRTIDDYAFKRLVPAPEDAILCRVTKPLVSMAFDLIKRRIACHVEGREIGQSLATLVKKFDNGSVSVLREDLEAYLYKEEGRLIEQGKEAKAEQLRDKVETLFVMIDTLKYNDPCWKLTELIESLFKDSTGADRPTVTLSTVHKAKGREWNTVYLYGRDKFMPSKWARQDWQIGQEHNLIYVAVTRAKKELIEVSTQILHGFGQLKPEQEDDFLHGAKSTEPPEVLHLGPGMKVIQLDEKGEAIPLLHETLADALGEEPRVCIPPDEILNNMRGSIPYDKIAYSLLGEIGVSKEAADVLNVWCSFNNFVLDDVDRTEGRIILKRKEA